MDFLFFFLSFLSLLALIIGFIKPNIVIRWGENKNRKKVLKYYGLAVIVFFILSIIAFPSITVEDHVENAQEHMKQNEYEEAISDYESAFEDWDENNNYPFTYGRVEEGFDSAKKEYSQELTEQAEATFNQGELDEAETKLKKAQEYWPDNDRIPEIKPKITTAINKRKADKHLDKAEEYIDEEEFENASEEISKASQIISDYSRISNLNEAIKDELKNFVSKKLDKADKELDNWNLSNAKTHISSANELLPDNTRVKDLKKTLREKEDVINQIGEKPENSSWDGSVRPVKEYLNKHLKDPDSVEYIEWSYVHLAYVGEDPVWRVRVKYRAKNSFGGYVIEEKLAYMIHEQVIGMENF